MRNKSSISAIITVDGRDVNFRFNIGTYDNFITFLDSCGLSFIKYNKIDFNKVPLNLRGQGYSNNLSEYLSNNTNNTELVFRFLNYFVITIISIRYLNDKKLNFHFSYSPEWQTMRFRVSDVQQYQDPIYYIITTTTSTTTTTTSTTTSSTTTTTTTVIIIESLFIHIPNLI